MNDENVSPNHNKTTPPTSKKVRNPFDKVLIDSLHKPICSPGMCKIYKKKSTGTFRWDIDQACTLVPTDIVACSSQFEPSPDPALEKIAEEANERFFSQEMVMPSPLMSSKKVTPLLQTSVDAGIQISSVIKEQIVVMKDVSVQTVLTLPPVLPPEIEKILAPFCTYLEDQKCGGDEIISLRRKLFIEEHSEEHYDSEQTDDEVHVEPRPPSSFEAHTPIVYSPDLSQNAVSKGMKRTFGTPLNKSAAVSGKPYRNKILDVVDYGEPCFSPIEFHTPRRLGQEFTTSTSLASVSISPVTKATSSDEEKNNLTSPESEAMATCLDCIDPACEKKGPCFCGSAHKLVLRRCSSLQAPRPHAAPRTRDPRDPRDPREPRRSLSLSSLHRSRSVQKLDFSMDMSVDGSLHDNSQDSVTSPLEEDKPGWSIVEEASIHRYVKLEKCNEKTQEMISSTKIHTIRSMLDDTPVKSSSKPRAARDHEISKIRRSPLHMSLDASLDNDAALDLEHRNIDFNTVDLKFLTDNVSRFDYTATKYPGDSSSFKRVDSGFNDNTFYTNASSYYESAIKPSELTVTNVSNKTALKEISNVNWMRIDSGFRDDNSADSVQFYPPHESGKKMTFCEAKIEDKENIATEDFDKFLGQTAKGDTMSMSDIFSDEMTFNCNFSSTPSKNKSRKVHS